MVQLVGILNVTPDSFSDGGQFLNPEAAVRHAKELFDQGASIVDVGAESTRPNATTLTDEEEWQRLEPVLRELLKHYPGKISLDSYHPATVRRALEIGPVIVNDITGMHNPEMVRTVLDYKPRVIISHLPGADIQKAHQKQAVRTIKEVKTDLLARAALLEAGGMPRENIILDPGIGFGKTMALNHRLLTFAHEVPDYQVMIGYSRKRFLGDKRMELATNLEAGKVAIASGAAYLRVHDVAGHQQLLRGDGPKPIRTFAEANEALHQFWPDQLTRPNIYSLDMIIPLMAYLGNPQEKLRIIHVAGTSGKTSTTYYAAALLKAAGKKVGLTASPHVDEINERVQVNAVPLAEAEFCSELTMFLELIKKSGFTPSYFEVMVAFAFWEFVRAGMEYAAIEVGLGGLMDATNVIRRPDKVCVITDIGLDHMNRLGNTLGEIAEQKAGIIQLHNSVLCYDQAPEIMEQITDRVRRKQADLEVLSGNDAESGFDFLPLFQQRNLGLARAAVNRLLQQSGNPALTDAQVAEAARVHIPARMEEVRWGERTIIIDGAHNGQKLHALAESVHRKYPGQKIAGVVSFVGNRSFRLEDSAAELAKLLDHVIITGFNGQQDGPHASEDPEVLAELFRRHGIVSLEIAASPAEALGLLLTRPEPLLMVTGSFYLLNHIRPLLRDDVRPGRQLF